MCVSEAEWRKLRKNLSGHTILMSINGTIGNLAFFKDEKVVLGKSAAYLNVTPGIDKEYVFYSLSTSSTAKYFENELTGTTIRNLSLASLRNTPIPIPKAEAEQHAIATALSDVDALISELDKLIAKKRNLKQAAMQRLLTGKQRLPGFLGRWEKKRLGDVAEIRKGQLITEKNAIPGSVPVIAGGKKPSYFHNRPNRTGKTITISASGASAGYISFFTTPIFASDCSTISESATYAIEFLFYQLMLKQEKIYKMQTGGAQPHVHPVDLMPLEMGMPEFAEQIAIASVLSDMDAEIAALERRRDKTRDLKQGMMQELLTGRRRLV